MKTFRILLAASVMAGLAHSWALPASIAQDSYSEEDQNRKVLKQAVVGAGTGAIASGASGGSAGKGALIGAGTSVIGNALVDTLTAPGYVQASDRGYSEQHAGQAARKGMTTDNNLMWGVLLVVLLAVVGMVLYLVIGQKSGRQAS